MNYIIDPQVVDRVVQRGIGLPLEDNLCSLVDGLLDAYGEHIYLNDRWCFSNAGGIMGKQLILHASTREYLVLWASPHGTEGHSGRHRAELWDWVLHGELSTYFEHDLQATTYRPGQLARLARGQANSSKVPDTGCWLIEYGRGQIPTQLPFALLDAFTSTMDTRGIAETFKVYTACVLREAALARGLRAWPPRGAHPIQSAPPRRDPLQPMDAATP